MALATSSSGVRPSWLGRFGRDVFWVFPAAEVVHFFGLCLLIGAMLLVDLRLLGFARRGVDPRLAFAPPDRDRRPAANSPAACCSFAPTRITIGRAPHSRLKLVAVGLAGANALWFKLAEAPRAGSATTPKPTRHKKHRGSLVFIWAAVIVLGRFLPSYRKARA